MLERAQELRFNNPHAPYTELYFESVDWLRKVPEMSVEDIAIDVIRDYQGVRFDSVIAIGQPASHVFELAQEGLGNPAAEYVDTAWVSQFGLDSDSLRQPERVYQSLRALYPAIERLVYLGSDTGRYQDEVDFDTGSPIQLLAGSEFDTHEAWDAFRSDIRAGDLVLVDSSMTRIGTDLHFPYEIVAEIAQDTDVPILVTQAPMLDLDGVLGGLVLDSFQLGRALVDIVNDQVPDLSRLTRQVYNYAELKRFGLNVAGLSGDVEIRGEPVVAISSEQFKGYVVLGLVLFGAFVLAWLYRERARNRKLSEANAHNSELYAELKQRQRNAGLALDAAQIAYYSYEHSTGVFEADGRFKRLYGAGDEAAFDFKRLEQQIHPEDLAKVLNFRQQAYAEQHLDEDFTVNYRIRPLGGQEYVWLKAFARQYQIDDERWTLGCILSIDAEMRAQTAYEQIYQHLKVACEMGGLYIIETNLDSGEARYVIRPTQGETEPLSNEKLLSCVDPAYHPALKEAQNSLGVAVEFPLHYPGWAEPRWTRDQVVERWSDENGEEHIIILSQDIDATHRAKQAVADARNEAQVLAAERQAALESLERRQQAQQQMFAVIGHELRTPAAALSMMLDSQRDELTDEEVKALPYARDINATAKHLMDVLDDLRAVVEPESINFRTRDNAVPLDVVEGCLTPLRDRLKTANLWVQLNSVQGAAESFAFDAKGMRQIITNLVKNAAIHSGASELKLGLTLERNDQGQQQLHVELADNGKGIPKEQWESIFEPFERGDTEADGTGLGLHICREIARASGGELILDASPDGGCRFTLLMPLDDVVKDQEDKPVSLACADSLSGKSILFAEDNLTLRMLTEQILKGLDAQYKPAINGAEALALAAEQDFDLVLTDIFMPEVDGFELVETLRKRGFNKPIIGITAAMVGDETERLLAVGADIVVPKPVTRDKLEAAWAEVQETRRNAV